VGEFLNDYYNWFTQAVKALEYSVHGRVWEPPYKGLVVVGMGGSGIVGDVVYVLATEVLDIPVTIVKDFTLPKWVGEGWLVVAVSYSGNTMETLHVVKEGISKGVKAAAIASGGRLIELAVKEELPYIQVDSGYAPRSAFPALLLSTLKLLKELGLGLHNDLKNSINVLRNRERADALAEEVIKAVAGRIPFFIASTKYYPLAVRAKNEFNENAKVLAKAEVVPEWGHNDIVGWEGWREPVAAIVFKEAGNEIMKFVADHLKASGVPVKDLEIDGSDYVGDVLKWSQVVGIASVKFALELGIDPRVTKSISRYKAFLKSLLKLD